MGTMPDWSRKGSKLSGAWNRIMKPLWEMTKLERAQQIAEKFVDLQRASWQSTWPLGFCLNASLLLAPLIRIPLEWSVTVAVGTVLDGRPHAWVETPDEDIVDPTLGQFLFGEPLLVLSAENALKHSHVRALSLTLREENIFREAIRPSAGNGWAPWVDVETLFSPHPYVSPALSGGVDRGQYGYGRESVHME